MSRVSSKIVRKDRKQEYAKKAVSAFQRAVAKGAAVVQKDAIESITSGAKTGITYEKYVPRRTHTASAACEAPAADEGILHTNIAIEIDPDRMGAAVESRAEYSSFLEFGTKNMAARPFLQPALEKNRKKIINDMTIALRRIK